MRHIQTVSVQAAFQCQVWAFSKRSDNSGSYIQTALNLEHVRYRLQATEGQLQQDDSSHVPNIASIALLSFGGNLQQLRTWRERVSAMVLTSAGMRTVCSQNATWESGSLPGKKEKLLVIRRSYTNSVHFYINSLAWVRERTTPTGRLPLVGEVGSIFADRGCCVVSVTDFYGCIIRFLDRDSYFSIQVAQLSYILYCSILLH
jgi:hypothetical protein